jgi:hypothetical protein
MKKGFKKLLDKPEINILGGSREFYENLREAYTTDGIVDCVALSQALYSEFLSRPWTGSYSTIPVVPSLIQSRRSATGSPSRISDYQ